MSKVLLTIAAGVLGLGLTGATADAHEGGHARGPVIVRGGPGYHQTHGVRFSGGYYYRGQDHRHWGHRVWDPGHRRFHYWDPHLNVYFYWYAPGNCYYPITYCP